MSTQAAAPFIYFDQSVREALEFYRGVLGGNVQVFTVDDAGTAKVAGPDDRVTFGRFDAEEVHIVAGASGPGQELNVGGRLGVYLTIADDARLARVFQGLAKGGQVNEPLSPRPWGRSGRLTDRHGIPWTVSKG